jgi:hypothetical protein
LFRNSPREDADVVVGIGVVIGSVVVVVVVVVVTGAVVVVIIFFPDMYSWYDCILSQTKNLIQQKVSLTFLRLYTSFLSGSFLKPSYKKN